jgi:protein-S-isoprenylcysteine O-methyltransferase Ste14
MTAVPMALLASVFLLLGVANLVSPQVAENALAQNTRNCSAIILTAVVMAYALLRPFSGGLFLCACSVLLAFVFRFHPIFLALAGLILLLGVMSIVRSRLSRRAASKDFARPS